MIVLGCGGDNPTAPSRVGSEQAARLARIEPSEIEEMASMESHYGAAILAHDALRQGDLERFRARIALASDQPLPASAPPHWRPFHALLQAAARRGVEADHLDAAADAFARVVLSCGSCHQALGMGPPYSSTTLDEGSGARETVRLDHEWATERLWEGIAGPRNDAWHRGADALAAREIFGQPRPGLERGEEFDRRARQLRELAEAARIARPPAERAALYGRMLASCGGCHQLIGVKLAAAQ